jgi:hypothetical protein
MLLVQARCLKVKGIVLRVCLHGTPGPSAAACNEPGRRSGATRVLLSWAINVLTNERTGPATGKTTLPESLGGRVTWPCHGEGAGRCAAPCHVSRVPGPVAHSKRPGGKTNHVSHWPRLIMSPKECAPWEVITDTVHAWNKIIWIQNDLVSQFGQCPPKHLRQIYKHIFV